MRILHISSAITWRGGEQQIVYLLEALAKRDIRCYLMAPEDSVLASYKFQSNISCITYRKSFLSQPGIALKIKKVCVQEKIDLIHFHDSHAHTYGWLSYLLFKNPVPSVLSRRVDFPISRSSIKKYNHPSIKKIICVSDFIGSVLLPDIKDDSKLITVHSGIDLAKFDYKAGDTLKSLFNIPNDSFIIGNIAAIADHKDYFTFVNTAETFFQSYDHKVLFLIIGGDAGEEKRLKDHIRSKGLEDKIVLCGHIPEAYRFLKELDVFLFTSKMEGLGTSVLDAFASGVPVVTTNAGGIKEVAIHKKNSLVSDIGDHIVIADHLNNMLSDESLKKQLVSGALETVSRFSKEITASKTIRVYKDVVSS